MKRDENTLIFASGKTIYANSGIVGINSNGYISQGYDGGIDDELTRGESIELADYFIALWLKWKKMAERMIPDQDGV